MKADKEIDEMFKSISKGKPVLVAETQGKMQVLVAETYDGKFLIYNGNLYMKCDFNKPESNTINVPKFI